MSVWESKSMTTLGVVSLGICQSGNPVACQRDILSVWVLYSATAQLVDCRNCHLSIWGLGLAYFSLLVWCMVLYGKIAVWQMPIYH